MLDVLFLILPILLPIFTGAAVARAGATTVATVVVLPVLTWISAQIWPGTMLGKL